MLSLFVEATHKAVSRPHTCTGSPYCGCRVKAVPQLPLDLPSPCVFKDCRSRPISRSWNQLNSSWHAFEKKEEEGLERNRKYQSAFVRGNFGFSFLIYVYVFIFGWGSFIMMSDLFLYLSHGRKGLKISAPAQLYQLCVMNPWADPVSEPPCSGSFPHD